MTNLLSTLSCVVALAVAGVASFASAQLPASGTRRMESHQTDDSVTRKALASPTARWRQTETAHAILYVRVGSAAAGFGNRLADSAEHAIASNLAWLGEKNAGPKLRLFFVGTRDEIQPLTGSRAPGWSVTDEGTAFFVASDTSPPALRHETMHLLSWRLWGSPAGTWLSEGLATAAVPACGGLTPEQVVAMFGRAGMLVSFDVLRHQFGLAGDTGFVHYYEAASLVREIDRVYGRERLRALWRDGGLSRTKEILGVDLPTLERDWRAAVAKTIPPTPWISWPEWRIAMRTHGCD